MVDAHDERTYRQLVQGHLPPMRVAVQETDLSVYAKDLRPDEVREAIIAQRGYIEGYLQRNPGFAQALTPWRDDPLAPPIVQNMIKAGQSAGVGPMAGVAGAVAEMVGRTFLDRVDELIIENGGDIFLMTDHPLNVAIYAGNSPLSLKVALKITPLTSPLAVCTSSATVGHSLSFGIADAVCVLSRCGATADAGATAIGNHIHHPDEIASAIQWGQTIPGVTGILVIVGDKMGGWGDIELAPPAALA